jgi:pimeloyl-ACP methyl ester carboxylesterase
VVGFSIGGMVAQEITLQVPNLVRKLILVGTGPRGGEGMASLTQVAQRIFGAAYDPPEHLWLAVLFSPSEAASRRDSDDLCKALPAEDIRHRQRQQWWLLLLYGLPHRAEARAFAAVANLAGVLGVGRRSLDDDLHFQPPSLRYPGRQRRLCRKAPETIMPDENAGSLVGLVEFATYLARRA